VWQPVSALVLIVAGVTEAGLSWRGTVKVDGMIYEPGGYHPYVATITLHLREGERSVVPGGFRVALVSEGSTNAVRTSVHQTGGLMLCSGTGTETLPRRAIGYLDTKAGQTTYHLAVPRAFGAFTCGQNHAVKRDRVVMIGDGDAEPADIETGDSVLRTLEEANSVLRVDEDPGARSLRVQGKLVACPQAIEARHARGHRCAAIMRRRTNGRSGRGASVAASPLIHVLDRPW
jgi:hypothetical protein